jgi:hypothetical protein
MTLRGRFRSVRLVWVVAIASLVGVASAAPADPFPGSVYPPPVASRGGALGACPNPAGLERFDPTTIKLAVRIAGGYDRTSLAVDLRNSDRAWWPQVRHMWRSGTPGQGVDSQVVEGSQSGPNIAFAVIVGYACGSTLLAKSLTVAVGPRYRHGCDACVSSLFFVDRCGRALIYYLY